MFDLTLVIYVSAIFQQYSLIIGWCQVDWGGSLQTLETAVMTTALLVGDQLLPSVACAHRDYSLIQPSAYAIF